MRWSSVSNYLAKRAQDSKFVTNLSNLVVVVHWRLFLFSIAFSKHTKIFLLLHGLSLSRIVLPNPLTKVRERRERDREENRRWTEAKMRSSRANVLHGGPSAGEWTKFFGRTRGSKKYRQDLHRSSLLPSGQAMSPCLPFHQISCPSFSLSSLGLLRYRTPGLVP